MNFRNLSKAALYIISCYSLDWTHSQVYADPMIINKPQEKWKGYMPC